MLSVMVAAVMFAQGEGPRMPWLTDYAAGVKQAKEQKRLLVVHFWADW